DRGVAPALAQRRLVGTEGPRAGGDDRFHAEVAHHEDQRLSSSKVRVEIVPHLAQPLALGEQYYQPVDRGRERSSTVRPRSLPEQRHYLRILGEEFELRGQRESEPFQRSTSRHRQ